MNLDTLIDMGMPAIDPSYDLALEHGPWDDAAPAAAPLAPLPFVPVGPVLTTPAVEASVVAAIMERHELAVHLALVKAEGLGDVEGVAWHKGRTRALRRAQDYLSRAAHERRTLATQLLGGAWVVIGSQGDRYRLVRDGVALRCDCPHGRRVAAGEATAGFCWHAELVPAIEEAQDEQASAYGVAA